MALKWYGNQVLAEVQVAKDAILAELAFAIEEEAKVNINRNNQIDTGFMLNSTYTVVTGQRSSFGTARTKAKAKNKKAEMGSEVSAPKDGAVVAVGANYAIYQEVKKSFLYTAGQTVARKSGSIISANKIK